jgi:hypothetical protein
VIQPTPAIVAQDAVRRLPRWALVLVCVAYVLPGFVAREPWKTQDMSAFGYMFALARGATSWFDPRILGLTPEFQALLPYWLGAWSIRLAPGWVPLDFAARLPFMGLLVLTLAATWWAIYHLARRPLAQPVAFAFGGEARPTDYARSLADAGLLALVATLGLAQLGHETTPALAQLGFASLAFYGLAALPGRDAWPPAAVAAGLPGLALSGAPTLALLIGLGGAALMLLADPMEDTGRRRRWAWAAFVAFCAMTATAIASALDLWHWRIGGPRDLRSDTRMLVWFTWPAWPLALWTLWRWRRQLASRHVALPLWIALACTVSAVSTPIGPRSLLLALPAYAALAAFALPTLRRSVAALIDWFTLLFFSAGALVIWVVWVSLQTGVPAKPAANVARLAPGFEPGFSVLAFGAALAGTLGWALLVRWRVGRHQSALWKSLVLPAGGATLCWLLLMTLWLPVLDYARSYVPSVTGVLRVVGSPGCIEVAGLTRAQLSALAYHGGLTLRPATAPGTPAACPWRVVGAESALAGPGLTGWQLVDTVRRPTDARDTLRIYRVQP